MDMAQPGPSSGVPGVRVVAMDAAAASVSTSAEVVREAFHARQRLATDGAQPLAPPRPTEAAAAALSPSVGYSARAIAASLVAGGIAGGLSRTAVAPLERLKILQQVQSGAAPRYRGVFSGLYAMAREEGLRGMLKGNGANCARIIPNSAVKFLTYELLTDSITASMRARDGPGAELTALQRLGAGALAGIVAMSSTYPLDMIRGRLTVQSDGSAARYRGMAHAARSIVREEGAMALYKGWLPSVIGVIPYVGLNFAVYESLKATTLKLHGLTEDRELSVGARLGCGAAAGSVGQTVAYPFDVLRRRLQVAGWQGATMALAGAGAGSGAGGADVPAAHAGYRGMTDCLVRTVREEGIGALFRGLAPNYLKVVPSIAIAFVSYELIKDVLNVEFKIGE